MHKIYKNNYNIKYELLHNVFKPARYIGTEINSIHKSFNKVNYRIGLVYPDLYEIGMSNLSIKILYYLINDLNDVQAERIFLPDDDLIEILKEKKINLFSLESWTPINEFNIIGFSIHSELTYTNILHILDLGNIPVLSKNRTEKDPIIIAGGSNILNPLPISPFFDLIFIGEAEEKIIEIINIDKKLIEKNIPREKRLEKLSGIEGIWYPKKGKYRVKKAVVSDLDKTFYHKKDMIPFVKTIQDRPVIEIARGCNNGCRFCQAGFYYRPYRERSLKTIIKIMHNLLQNTGYDEINFTSLSVADYSQIKLLIDTLSEYLSKKHISISLPSLRVYSFNIDYLKKLSYVRKPSLTFAIEAGDQELRNKINKYFDEPKFYNILEELVKQGWRHVKFYFIIGFPDVKDEENRIIDFLKTVINNFPQLSYNVSIALLIPKSFTVFENSPQLPGNVYLERIRKIKSSFRRNKINIKYVEPIQANFEYFFSINDENSSKFLLDAFKHGIKREGWHEHFNNNFWENILDNKDNYKKPDLTFIDAGYTNDFFDKEMEKYKKGELTQNCVSGNCYFCGICNKKIKNIIYSNETYEEIQKLLNSLKDNRVGIQYLIKNKYTKDNINNHNNGYIVYFNKFSLMQFVGHIDFYNFVMKFFKIIGFDFIYSEGYNPSPKFSFYSPNSIFVETFNDIFYFETNDEIIDFKNLILLINKIAPFGFSVNKFEKCNNFKKFKKDTNFEVIYKIKTVENKDKFTKDIENLIISKINPDSLIDFSNFQNRLIIKSKLKDNFKNFLKVIPFKVNTKRYIKKNGN